MSGKWSLDNEMEAKEEERVDSFNPFVETIPKHINKSYLFVEVNHVFEAY